MAGHIYVVCFGEGRCRHGLDHPHREVDPTVSFGCAAVDCVGPQSWEKAFPTAKEAEAYQDALPLAPGGDWSHIERRNL